LQTYFVPKVIAKLVQQKSTI